MSIKTRFKYESDVYTDPHDITKIVAVIDRPKIPIILKYNKLYYPSTAPVSCILDSGSDINLFPAHWGMSLGIDVKSLPSYKIDGIGNTSINVYSFEGIEIYVENIRNRIHFKTKVDFSFEHEVPLLGRLGFFKYFKKIIFIDDQEVELKF